MILCCNRFCECLCCATPFDWSPQLPSESGDGPREYPPGPSGEEIEFAQEEIENGRLVSKVFIDSSIVEADRQRQASIEAGIRKEFELEQSQASFSNEGET